MKNLLRLSLVLMIALVTINTNAEDKVKKTKEVTYSIHMDCQGCVNKITKNIPYEKGVKDLNVDFKKQTVTVKYRADKTNSENLVKAFEKLGFKAKESKPGENHSSCGKSCGGCTGHKH